MDSASWFVRAGGRGIAAAVLASSLLLGCGVDEEEPSDSPRATASRSTVLAASSSSPTAVSETSENLSDDTCARSQRRVHGGMEWPLLQVVWLLTSDVDGTSAEASEKAVSTVERAVAKVTRSCASLPVEMATLESDVQAATAAPLDARRLTDLEDGFARWARAIGARGSPMQGATATLRHCNELAIQVRAGYALWWDYIPAGKRWWVQMVVENDIDKRFWLDLAGTMRVTGQVYPQRGRRRSVWGGSSADSMYAKPSTTSSRRVGLTEFLHTSSDGEVYDVQPEVFIFYQGRGCSLPVPRLN
jgi:hypothetical protein